MPTLRYGQTVHCVSTGAVCQVESLLGEGGQGEVFRVNLEGRPFALKWYNDLVLERDRGLRERLRVAIDKGAPSAKFIWPFELAALPDGRRLGYLMRLRRSGYESFYDLLGQQIRPSFRVLAMAACRLTDALFALHGKGLAYQDLNAGNVFFDPATGDIEICDNDNVDRDGAPSVMGGVWEFQAPEVVLRRAGPSRATDLHSLAVMLFRVLHIGHPLLGRKVHEHANLADLSAVRSLYGTAARFVFDPVDESNRPLPEEHGPVIGHWEIYPQFLRDLFVRAFTEGLHDPQARVQESEWRQALSQLHDSVLTCTACGAQNFHDPRRLAQKQPTFACWSCRAALSSAPPRMGIRLAGARANEPPLHTVVLEPGARLYAHHAASGRYEFDAPSAVVEGPPLQLRNVSNRPWAISSVGEGAHVSPGDAVRATSQLRIRFERTEGEIRM